MRKQLITALLVLAAASTTSTTAQVLAQDLNKTVVGCVELECPARSHDTANDNSAIANTGSFPYVRRAYARVLQRVLFLIPSIQSVLGQTRQHHRRHISHSSFYQATPPTSFLNASTGTSAERNRRTCAFSGNATDEVAEGTCGSAVGSSCVIALVSRAKSRISD
ncbi:hypothetical protein F5B19DRAFT_353558 [Rostrohypoxylon terebratum]|nr:hypothetical protein F5B19DRAFT_353558 [Rostrohypoxylon terebratum]